MKLYCLAQGSSGNCYILENDNGKQLILDAGVDLKGIVNSQGFTGWRNVEGVLITHSHKDHSLSEQRLMQAGLNIYSYDTIKHKEKIVTNSFIIYVFEGRHDTQVFGFIIKERHTNKVLAYATDTCFVPYIKGVNYWLVECNFDISTWEQNVQRGDIDYNYLGRLYDTHLSLEYLCSYFKDERITRPELIIPCHLGGNLNIEKLDCLAKFTNRLERAKKGECYIL